jgi:hypothetical protein
MPQGIEHERRVFDIEQGLRVGRVTQHPHAPVLGVRLQPTPSRLQCLHKTIGFLLQRLGLRGAEQLAQSGNALGKNISRQTECRQQFTRRRIADASREHQAQPPCQLIALHRFWRLSVK